MRSVVDRNVVMRRITVIIVLYLLHRGKNGQTKEMEKIFLRLTFARLLQTIRILYISWSLSKGTATGLHLV